MRLFSRGVVLIQLTSYYSNSNCYRPHPKEGGDTTFTGVCLFTILPLASCSRLGLGSTPVPGWRYPPPPSSQDRVGYPPQPGQNRVNPHHLPPARTGWTGPPPRDRTAERVLATRRWRWVMPLAFTQEDCLVTFVLTSVS